MVLLLSEARRMDCAFAQAGMAASSTRKKKRVVRIERSPESRFDLKYIPLLACRTWERIAIGLCGDAAKSILLAVREKMPASEDGRLYLQIHCYLEFTIAGGAPRSIRRWGMDLFVGRGVDGGRRRSGGVQVGGAEA